MSTNTLINQFEETPDKFMSRTYVNYVDDRVWVYDLKLGVGIPSVWTVTQAKQYLQHLRQRVVL